VPTGSPSRQRHLLTATSRSCRRSRNLRTGPPALARHRRYPGTCSLSATPNTRPPGQAGVTRLGLRPAAPAKCFHHCSRLRGGREAGVHPCLGLPSQTWAHHEHPATAAQDVPLAPFPPSAATPGPFGKHTQRTKCVLGARSSQAMPRVQAGSTARSWRGRCPAWP